MFWDRVVQYPGRVKLTDPSTGDYVFRDTERAEGNITDEGTTLDRVGFDEALASYFDVGQINANYIADNYLSDTGVTITSGITGSVKYGQVGDLTIVTVKLQTNTAISGYLALAGGIPSAYRPTGDIRIGNRGNDRQLIRLGTDGRISVDGDYAIGQQFNCEFAF